MEAKGDDSIDAVVERAAKAGHKINRATVDRYVRGEQAKKPPEATLQALAAGLNLDVRELRALARMPRGELGPWKPVPQSSRLDQDQRDALDQLIKTITASQEADDGTPTSSKVIGFPAGAGNQLQKRAARRRKPEPPG